MAPFTGALRALPVPVMTGRGCSGLAATGRSWVDVLALVNHQGAVKGRDNEKLYAYHPPFTARSLQVAFVT